MIYTNNKTKKINIGNVVIGGSDHVVIQSMTNTKTSDIKKTLNQINSLVKNGCELVRVAVLDEKDLIALKKICQNSSCPIIADIHYNHKFAIGAIENGVKKIRINPGNISNKNDLIEIIDCAKKHNVAIRIGINNGSLPKNIKPTAQNIVNLAIKYIKIFESRNFFNIIVSLKSSDQLFTEKLYKLAATKIKYPLHLGVTEAGTQLDATIKSCIGLSNLIKQHIGNTIRISVSGSPLSEPIIAKKILNSCGIKQNIPNIIACPSCGRCLFDFDNLLTTIENWCNLNPKNLNICVMGCVVNGLGEAKNADIGIYGLNKDAFVLYVDKQKIGTFSFNKVIQEFQKYYAKK